MTNLSFDVVQWQVKKAWCRVICLKGWGTGMRARIVARRVYCRKPTEEEWSPFAEARYKEAQPEDVREALDKGHEVLGNQFILPL